MQPTKVKIDGRSVDPGHVTTDREGTLFIDLNHVKSDLRALVDTIVDGSQVVICQNDRCLTWDAHDLLYSNGRTFVRMDSLTAAFDLHHQIRGDTILINTARPKSATGLGIGDTPPKIELPDIDTGLAVESSDFRGQRVIFFMWASW